MKKISLQLSAVILLSTFAACSSNSVLSKYEEDLTSKAQWSVIAFETGENIVLPVHTNRKHRNYDSFSGGELGGNVTCSTLDRWLNECQGCDECMQYYADKGLIDYKVTKRDEHQVVADVELTSKGRKYLLVNMMEGADNYSYVTEFEDKGVVLVVANYEKYSNPKMIYELADYTGATIHSRTYICDIDEEVVRTPFLFPEDDGKDVETRKTVRREVSLLTYLEDGHEAIEYRDNSNSKILSDNKNCYDLSEYGSIEEVLKSKFCLSDTLACVYEAYPEKGGISFGSKKITVDKDGEFPDWFRVSLIDEEKTWYGTTSVYYLLGASFELDKIVSDRKWHWNMTEEPVEYSDLGQWAYEDWNMKELVYRIKVMASPFWQYLNDLDSDEYYMYGRCPYLQVGNRIYMPSYGMWGASKQSVCDASYLEIKGDVEYPAMYWMTMAELTKSIKEIYSK